MSTALAGKQGEYRVYQDDGGTIRVDVRAPKIPNEHGYGHTVEHGSTTRSRALLLARDILPGAVIVSAFRHDHMIGSQHWREYVVEAPAAALEAVRTRGTEVPARTAGHVFTVTVETTGEAPTMADIESALSFAYGWTVTARPVAPADADASDWTGDEYRACAECGDDVRTLSSRDRCDACEAE